MLQELLVGKEGVQVQTTIKLDTTSVILLSAGLFIAIFGAVILSAYITKN
jgi:hypothetical protein